MQTASDRGIGRALAVWTALVLRGPRATVLAVALVSLVLAGYTATHLGINSDNRRMLAEDVPSNQAQIAFSKLFPILDDALIVVIDGDTPELARDATAGLRDRLLALPDLFREVYEPGGGEFFQRNGLLYRDVAELEEFGDQLARVQPILAELEKDTSLAQLSGLVRIGLEQVRDRHGGEEEWASILDQVGNATVSVYSEYPVRVSWEELLLRGSALEVSTRRVLLIDAKLDFGSLLAAGQALRAIREAAAELGLDEDRGVVVRVTGNPALNFEEMIGIAWDIGVSGVFCFLLVAFVVRRALRAWSLTIAALTTLLVGLLWTAAFAAFAVGHVNLVSIAFAILFIGLGVDFGIHLGMHYAVLRQEGEEHSAALVRSAWEVGASLVLCTVTTSIGFFVFVPTDYRGVAELGLISGFGMLVMLFMTLTLFPALLSSYCAFDPSRLDSVHYRLRGGWMDFLDAHAVAVRWLALALGIGALVLVPNARFDPDVVRLRDPDSVSVQAFEDLLDGDDQTSPWFANAVEPDLAKAQVKAAQLRALPQVGQAITLEDFVPRDQEEKREILMDLSFMLDIPQEPGGTRAEASVADQVESLRELRDFLGDPRIDHDSQLAASVAKLREQLSVFLEKVEREGDAEGALESFEEVLLGNLPQQIARLRLALSPEEVTLADLPLEIRERMVAKDGQARVQIFPSENLNRDQAVERFVGAVTAVSPGATGMAVNVVEFGHVTVASLKQALISAVSCIAILLFVLWRRFDEPLLVLVPLLLGAALTVGSMVIVEIPFNFANVIVIPLVLGMGVDSGIHLVHRARNEQLPARELLGTTTARAVFYSAVTTVVSFGSLAFSSHRGMASLGELLVIGMGWTLFANLVVLPALLAWWRPSTHSDAGAAEASD